MQFTLNETQQLIQDGARRFFQESLDSSKVMDAENSEHGFPKELWTQMTQLGWTGVGIPESFGGGGCGNVDICILAEELGRAAASLPLAETAGFAATVLQAVEPTPLVKSLLSDIAASDKIITPALTEPDGRDERSKPKCQILESSAGGKVTGTKVMVPYASSAETALVSLISQTGTLVLAAIDLEAPGITISRQKGIGCTPLFQVTFENIEISVDKVLARGEDAEQIISAGLDAATMIGVAEVVGNCEAMIEISADYTKTREQFGKKIGSFQAVAHPIANMRINTDACRLLNLESAWKFDQGGDASLEISETKVFANEVVVDMLHAAHAVHGAIGYTMEYDLQLFTRRARAFCLSYGDSDRQTERAAVAMGL